MKKKEKNQMTTPMTPREAAEIMIKETVDFNETNPAAILILHWAALSGDAEITQTLVDRGANVNAKSDKSLTALHYAAFNNHVAVVKILLENGADVHATLGDEGGPPIHMTIAKDSVESAQLLIEHGADLHAKYMGLTPLDLAKKEKAFKVMEYLEPLMTVN